ncbi:hypothetical protein ABW19_dt0203882 [Dactylella cylindrospora]|nr:hypothetical protein ABW19_dt0203882 [Dactylella cylindrospora]
MMLQIARPAPRKHLQPFRHQFHSLLLTKYPTHQVRTFRGIEFRCRNKHEQQLANAKMRLAGIAGGFAHPDSPSGGPYHLVPPLYPYLKALAWMARCSVCFANITSYKYPAPTFLIWRIPRHVKNLERVP